MDAIRGVYEVAVKVRDLDRAEEFYRRILGFEVGLRDEGRRWIFMRAGGGGMIVLQEDKGTWPLQHFAFAVDEDRIDGAAAELSRHNVKIAGPIVHEWIPAKSVYFTDPDGHDLELCAPLRERP
jgi:catechol 2,3-dioxygenase-like lactoylglutathione lyase family enzyme